MASMTRPAALVGPGQRVGLVVGGIDTHKDLHVAAVVDAEGTLLGTAEFPTTRVGYRRLLGWMRRFGPLRRVGVEGTGCYGAGVARFLAAAEIEVAEVDRPDRSDRRRRGKSDIFDAIAAAQAARLGQRTAVPKTRDGGVEALRVLRLTRSGAVQARTKARQLLQHLIVAAPDPLRDQLRTLTPMRLVRTCAAWRPDPAGSRDPLGATRIALKTLAQRILALHAEIATLDRLIKPLVAELAPQLLTRFGIGIQCAGQLLVTFGDNPDRVGSEPAFAMLCGVAPLPASSGKTRRHRLNRGGDRRANSALHTIAVTRIREDPRTQAYVEKKTAEGHSTREITRCLKRLIAREVYYLLRPADQAEAA